MAEYLYPGVYVEEIPRGPHPIEGVPTNTTAMLGAAERGPIVPTRVTRPSEYARWFGKPGAGAELMAHAARGFFENGGQRLWVCRVVSSAATTAQVSVGNHVIAAIGPGAWGARLWVKLSPGSTRDGQGAPVGFRLRVALFAPGDAPADCFDGVSAAATPILAEDHDDLVMEPRSADYCVERLRASVLVELRLADPVSAAPPEFSGTLAGGADGTPIEAADFAPALAALEGQPDVSLLYAPAADEATQRMLVAHCERENFRFAVIDAPRGADPKTLEPRASIADTACAAYYTPWLDVPHEGSTRRVPPGGHVLGIYARMDLERGVHQAPANLELRGVSGLEFAVSDAQQDTLAPRGVNVIRAFAGRGIRVWGARTLSSRAEAKYVNIRRHLIYLQRSIEVGTQWTVFEPNDEALWAKLKQQVEGFLLAHWRSGALQGSKPEQAFVVICDRSVISANDLDLGILNCVIGVAPLKPAEFVEIHISHRLATTL